MSFAARATAFACLVLATVNAFAPIPRAMSPATNARSVMSMSPVDVAPMMDASVISQLPTQLVSLEVTTAAFLAVLLGTFFPCFFLITLYIQSEGYKAGNPEEA